jgi:hypothetical protein
MGLNKNQLQFVENSESPDRRVWSGSVVNGLPHGWGKVCLDNSETWSHYIFGKPHFTTEMELPENVYSCSFIGKDGLVFSGCINMGIPIQGTVTLEDYKFVGMFNKNSCSPSFGTRFFKTDDGEATWFGRFDIQGQRTGVGLMTYADSTQVKGTWENDDICDSDICIIFNDKTQLETMLLNGFCHWWPTIKMWHKIQTCLVKELFYDTLKKQRSTFQYHLCHTLYKNTNT